MYQVSIERRFSATHAVTIGGRREEPHAHDWLVTVEVAGERLDADGLLCDFCALQQRLEQIVGPFDGADLNRTPPFDEMNPTAELVAKHIAERFVEGLPDGVALGAVTVTEAPGCRATYG